MQRAVIAGLEQLQAGLQLENKVVSIRYTEGLPGVDPSERENILVYLRKFVP